MGMGPDMSRPLMVNIKIASKWPFMLPKMGLFENMVYHHVSYSMGLLWVYPIFKTHPLCAMVKMWCVCVCMYVCMYIYIYIL